MQSHLSPSGSCRNSHCTESNERRPLAAAIKSKPLQLSIELAPPLATMDPIESTKLAAPRLIELPACAEARSPINQFHVIKRDDRQG